MQIQQFQKRFKKIPKIIELDHLTVTGDVYFGRNVTLRGTVIIVANEGQRIDIPDGCVLENRLLAGNLTMTVRGCVLADMSTARPNSRTHLSRTCDPSASHFPYFYAPRLLQPPLPCPRDIRSTIPQNLNHWIFLTFVLDLRAYRIHTYIDTPQTPHPLSLSLWLQWTVSPDSISSP